MQKDMHYFGTYAIARTAGLTVDDAHTVAFSAQFVDDATSNNSKVHEDGGMIYGIATAHHGMDVIKNRITDSVEQRRVWIPFHFFPGNEGNSLSEKLLCRKDSALAQEMMKNHIKHAITSPYGLQLMGIAAHVYEDTFAHYGFSGISSRSNTVDGGSFDFFDVQDPNILTYINTKFSNFIQKYAGEFIIDNWRKLASDTGEKTSGALGHGAVGTYPDRPFLHWTFKYEHLKQTSVHNNQETFLECCEKLHSWLSQFADQYYPTGKIKRTAFSDIKEKIAGILKLEAKKTDRIAAWQRIITSGELFDNEENEKPNYNPDNWEESKSKFTQLDSSSKIVDTQLYRYHQAAIYHRYYTLKHLLPKYKIIVF